MPIEGMLLDLDGTLVDTNALHVQAWINALESKGYRVAADRIAIEIGKGGDALVPSLLGVEANEKHGDLCEKRNLPLSTNWQNQDCDRFPVRVNCWKNCAKWISARCSRPAASGSRWS